MKLNIQLFATTLGSTSKWDKTYGGSSNAYNFSAEVIQNSQDITGNKSNITVNFYAYGGSGWRFNGFNSPTAYISIDGKQVKSATVSALEAGSSNKKKIATYTSDFTHNANGELTLKVVCSFDPKTTSYSYLPAKITLDTITAKPTVIPRESKFKTTTLTDVLLDNSHYLFGITQYLDTAYYKLTATLPNGTEIGTIDGIVGEDSSGKMIEWWLDATRLSKIYKSMTTETYSYTLNLYTYSDSAKLNPIGVASSMTISGKLPSSYKPSAAITYTKQHSSSAIKDDWGIIYGKTKLIATITGTPYDSEEYSKISSYSLKTSKRSSTSNTLTTDYIYENGTIEGYVKDKRGRTSDTVKTSYTVTPYASPTVAGGVYRSNSAGTAADDGTYIHYNISGTFSSCNGKNSIKYYVGYKDASSTGDYTWVEVASNKLQGVLANQISAATIYSVALKVTDAIGTSSPTLVTIIPASFKLLNYASDGSGLAIGKKSTSTSSNKKFEVAIPQINSNTINATGFSSTTDTGTVGTQSPVLSKLVIKQANNTEAPNNGVVLEYGNSANWRGQLFIGDNAEQGIYHNGWTNGTRGSWRKLYSDIYHPSADTASMANQVKIGARNKTATYVPVFNGNTLDYTERWKPNAVTTLDWNDGNKQDMIPTVALLAFWNGAFQDTASNLKYNAWGEMLHPTQFTHSSGGVIKFRLSNGFTIVSGNTTVKSSSATTISFGVTFAYYPLIMTTLATSTSGVSIGKIYDRTTTNFKCILGGSGISSCTCAWVAIGYTA